jgi:cysteine desulfurase / selenocysteine lyase
MSIAADTTGRLGPLDVERIRQDFPILDQQINGWPLAYLDNAATAQKPNCVIEAMDHYYRHDNANIHRAVHALGERATAAYEAARRTMADFINAPSEKEIIFLRGASEAVNLVAQAWARPRLGKDDEILITEMEHHSNIVPWQLVCQQTGAKLRAVRVTDDGELDMNSFEQEIARKPALFAVGHVSNAIGTMNPVAGMIRKARALGVPVLVDGAQAAPHMKIDVQALDCDFYTFSGHKMFGPSGTGVLWARRDLLEAMPPWQGGGEMIRMVRIEGSQWNDVPHKFEAGTPHIAGAVGLARAAEYVRSLGHSRIVDWEHQLLQHAHARLSEVAGLRIIGPESGKASVVSFVLDGVHPHDLGTILDHEGIAIRAGHHCAMPLMERLGLVATARASMAFYNTFEEIDRLAAALNKAREVLA